MAEVDIWKNVNRVFPVQDEHNTFLLEAFRFWYSALFLSWFHGSHVKILVLLKNISNDETPSCYVSNNGVKDTSVRRKQPLLNCAAQRHLDTDSGVSQTT